VVSSLVLHAREHVAQFLVIRRELEGGLEPVIATANIIKTKGFLPVDVETRYHTRDGGSS
jgi:hypothetical protein